MAWFKVNFFDPKGFFFPGEAVAGNITVNVQDEIICRELRLKFRGKSHCYWSEGTGDKRKSYSNYEDYFDAKVSLLSGGSQNEIQVSPGQYTYPFNFALPGNIPPSFESKRDTGYVRYYLKVVFDIRMKSDIQEQIPFMVHSAPMDLNLTPHLLEPVDSNLDKFLCCLCCQSGPIRVRCQISKQAFRPGEGILFNCEVDNMATDTELRNIEGRLIEHVMLISTTWHERHQRVLSSIVVSPGLQARSQNSWQNIQLNIPTDVIPSFENCRCVNLSYTFVLEVDIPAAIDAKVEFPITIANTIQGLQPMMVQPPIINAGGIQPGYDGMPYGAPPAGQPVYPPPAAVTMQPGWSPDVAPPPYPGK